MENHELASRPEWKTPKNVADAREMERAQSASLKEVLPSSYARIGWLKDRDEQLKNLLDQLQSLGVPMGAEDWALRASLRITKLCDESRAAWRALNAHHQGKASDWVELRREFEHARAMYVKGLPPTRVRCDWCGWHGARWIGGGYAACEDCLPQDKIDVTPSDPPCSGHSGLSAAD